MITASVRQQIMRKTTPKCDALATEQQPELSPGPLSILMGAGRLLTRSPPRRVDQRTCRIASTRCIDS